MHDGKVTLRIQDGVAIPTFNDPATLNAIGEAMRAAFTAALDAVEGPDSGVRCLLLTEAMALATRLAHGPTVAYGLMRRAYWQSPDATYADQLALEADLQSQAGRTADYREGVQAFMAKRPARFRGR